MTPAEWHASALHSLADVETLYASCLHNGPLCAFAQVAESRRAAHLRAYVTGLRAFRWRAHQRLNGAARAGREGT